MHSSLGDAEIEFGSPRRFSAELPDSNSLSSNRRLRGASSGCCRRRRRTSSPRRVERTPSCRSSGRFLIVLLRGQRVMLDADLAVLYGGAVKRLNEQVRRNKERFPPDFLLQLTAEEVAFLRSQTATLEVGRGATPRCACDSTTRRGSTAACSRSAVRRSS